MEKYAIEFDQRQFEPCVYFLCNDKKINYIGCSSTLGSRLCAHKRNGILFNRILFIPCETSQEAFKLEKELIYKYRPPYNKNISSYHIDYEIKDVTKQRLNEILLEPEFDIDLEIGAPVELTAKIAEDDSIISGNKFTLNKNNAIYYGRKAGKAPIYFIHPTLRETFLRAWPELGLPPINGKSVD